MNICIKIAGGIALSACVLQAFGVTLTPNQINNGNIPGNYSTIDFYTSNGNWTSNLTLPKTAADKSIITIHADAGNSSILSLTNTDIPLNSLTLSTGDTQKLVFNADRQRWLMDVTDYTPNSVGAAIPSSTRQIVRYSMRNGSWVPYIVLPATALPGAIIIIESAATKTGKIAADSIMYASTMGIATGENYVFKFHSILKKWYMLTAPVRSLQAGNLTAGKIRRAVGPHTLVTVPKNTASLVLELPDAGGDRDRVRIVSQSDVPSVIRNVGVNFSGSMQLVKGDAYNFMWVAEKRKWVMMTSPSRSYSAGALKNGEVPLESVPTMTIYASDANWAPIITLPTRAKPGDRVLFKSDASLDFRVVPGGKPSNFTSQTISTGDSVVFVVDASDRWQLETGIITMLNIYSDEVVAALGDQAARARQLDSLRRTNEALENSRVNFRVKMVGLMHYPAQGGSGDAIGRLPLDLVVQAERKRLKANAIYYEGVENNFCGMGYVNSSNEYQMVGAGAMSCGTYVMRHEFGHNMGLNHDASEGGKSYAVGYPLFNTVMTNDENPYYSTPKIYDPVLGMPLGIEGKIDSVRAMNERFPIVSKF